MKHFYPNTPAHTMVLRKTSKVAFLQVVKAWLLATALLLSGSQLLKAQCVAPYMSFHSPVLIDGTDNQVGAKYLFSEVMAGVDAHITVTDLVGGAVLYNIDDSTGAGYYDAFQPYVVAPANTVSYLDWEITFKVAGTDKDTLIPCFAITGVDVDGNGVDLQEFIEAATPGSYALDPFTILNFSFDGVRSKATSMVANIPLIDTAHREAMFQMNFQNIATLQYRNGAISTHGADMVRQTCIYFKSFFDNFSFLLPVKMTSFTAQSKNQSVSINWSATNENDLKYYTVQKSVNGTQWTDLRTVMPGASASNTYFITDAAASTAVVYYRIKQTDRNGHAIYSKALIVRSGNINNGSITNNTVVTDAINMQINAVENDTYSVEVYAMNGSKVKQQQLSVSAGFNSTTVDMPSISGNGLYVLTVKNKRGETIHHSKLIKN